MNIEEKFKKGADTHTYQRIDIDFKVNIFLGYNDNGFMSMVITEPGKNEVVKSSRWIDVSLKKREDQKMALSFDLLDNAYKSMFMVFCKDIIVICERAGSHMAISTALTRWKYWKEMFGKKKAQILDKHEIKGLIGELIELRDHFITEYDETTAIRSWMGPMLGHKDFEINETWYEVKTVNESAIQVNISSLEQLESDLNGHLVIIRLEDASATSELAINLNKLVVSVMDNIMDPENLDLFRERLDNMGYIPDDEYDNYVFVFRGRQSYLVTEDFPRLTRGCVPDSVGNVKYTLLLNGISRYLEES